MARAVAGSQAAMVETLTEARWVSLGPARIPPAPHLPEVQFMVGQSRSADSG